MEIIMARGDLEVRTFQIRSPSAGGGTEPYTEQLDEIYMTVKRNENDKNFLFQKRLSDGGIISKGDGEYEFTIQPEDTDGLAYGSYGFDVELVKNGAVKKTFCGELVLTKEYTHRANEGGQ